MATTDSTATIFDVTEASFEAEVLQRSFATPVVIDFWAEWCAPCRQLGPMLEQAVAARGGAIVLAKVDVDTNPRLAAAFGVQGIPAVKAVDKGRLVAEFVGLQPKAQVERFLDGLAPAAPKAAEPTPEVPPEQAAEQWRATLASDPDNVPARVGLAAQALEKGDHAQALELLRPVEHAPEAAAPMAAARLSAEADDPSSPFASAALRALDGAPEAALDELLAGVRNGGDTRDRARGLMLDVFRVLGDEDPVTQRYRRSLMTALY